jgi:T5SS/PEP-CTERM-associated repeat protein
VTNTKGYIGSNGVGTATIRGGTLANSDTLYVGFLGNGNLSLTGSNAATAGDSTFVADLAGPLTVNTSGPGTTILGGGITVGGVGTLDLGGYAVSNVITNNGGAVINAGGHAGTQSVTGVVSMTGTGAGTNYDFLSVMGGTLAIASGATMNLDFAGSGSTVDWNDPFWAANRSWTVIDVAGAGSSVGAFTRGTVSTDAFGQSLTSVWPLASFQVSSSGSDAVVVYVVPEPTAASLAVGSVA